MFQHLDPGDIGQRKGYFLAINLDAMGHRMLAVVRGRINSQALFFPGTQIVLSCHPLRSVHSPASQNKSTAEEVSVALPHGENASAT